nr:chromatin target of PRMT1 protein-like [Ipomoea batatas]
MAHVESHDGSAPVSSERAVSDGAVTTPPPVTTSLSSAHHFVSLKLSSRNYLLWRMQMVPFLSGQGLLGFVDGTLPCPPDSTPPPQPAAALRSGILSPVFHC